MNSDENIRLLQLPEGSKWRKMSAFRRQGQTHNGVFIWVSFSVSGRWVHLWDDATSWCTVSSNPVQKGQVIQNISMFLLTWLPSILYPYFWVTLGCDVHLRTQKKMWQFLWTHACCDQRKTDTSFFSTKLKFKWVQWYLVNSMWKCTYMSPTGLSYPKVLANIPQLHPLKCQPASCLTFH